MTKVLIMSRGVFETTDIGKDSVAISITSPGEQLPIPPACYKATIYMQFYDVTHSFASGAMKREHARRVVEFANRWFGKVDYITVHCEMGISRSAGVAAAILKWFTGNDRQIFRDKRYMPNMFCYQLVMEEFRRAREQDSILSPKWLEENNEEAVLPERIRVMHLMYGVENGKQCGDCSHFYVKVFSGRYFKCDMIEDSRGPGTDWRARWQACGKFEKRKD